MYNDNYNINIEALRSDLMDYYGTAAFSADPFAMMDVIDVERASADKLIRMAKEAGFDLRRYLY